MTQMPLTQTLPSGAAALVLYALTKADAPPLPRAIAGLSRAPLALMGRGDVRAVVSVHSGEALEGLLGRAAPEAVKEHAVDYHRCLTQLSASHDLLPVRFGTGLPDSDALDVYLHAQASSLSASLRGLAGGLEWSVRLVAEAAPTPQQGSTAGPQDYLRQRHRARQGAAAIAASRAQLAQSLASALAGGPALKVVQDPVSEDLAAQACFANLRALCPRGADSALMECVSSLVEDMPGAKADVYGPDAPFRFAQMEAAQHAI